MTYKSFTLIIFILFGINTYGNEKDTTIFDTSFEKKILQNIMDSASVDIVDLFRTVNYTPESDAISGKISRFVTQFKAKNQSNSNYSKLLKNLYKAVHAEFLKKYTEEAYFNDIFASGNYNCVTASALFSIILSKMEIENVVKVSPTHAYIIADPQKTSFFLETTLPTNGVYVFDEKFKKNYISYLHDNKIISDNDFKNESIEILFSKHYTTDKTISIKELAGVQYYNKGVFQYYKEDYKESLKSIEKALILYNDPTVSYMEYSALANILDHENNTKIYNGKNLALYLNNSGKNSENKANCNQYFQGVSHEITVNHPDINKYKNYYTELCQFINDSINYNDIKYTYYYALGYYQYSNYKYSEAIDLLETALKINPENITTKQLITDACMKKLAQYGKQMPDIDTINLLFKRFTFLLQNPNLTNYYIDISTTLVRDCYFRNDIKKGNQYLKQFESFAEERPNMALDNTNVAELYGLIATYNYRKSNYKAAIDVLIKGISIVPNSRELKARLNNIREAHPNLRNYGLNSQQSKQKEENEKIAINQNIEKYINNSWLLTYANDGYGNIIGNPSQKMIFTFMNPNKLIMKGNDEKTTGFWIYNKSNCTITLKSSSNEDIMNIVINSIDETVINGLMYFKSDAIETVEVSLTVVE